MSVFSFKKAAVTSLASDSRPNFSGFRDIHYPVFTAGDHGTSLPINLLQKANWGLSFQEAWCAACRQRHAF